ncbi:hypothetical protein GGI20_004259 [Coemansia sp. BCRC 34301]|nr:hypothetical protein GGI20_004259 [Coemansia sp. BCRC 34301]
MPKASKGKLRSALQNAQQRKAKIDAARRAHENSENKHKSVAKKTGGGNKKRSRGPFFPYRKHNVILLIGEGNFSFAHSIAKRLGSGVNITATAYDSQQVVAQKYTDDAARHIAEFEALGGTVLYDIDGTALESYPELNGKLFTHIVFNFPHAGAGIKDQAKNIRTNQLLMVGFFTSAQRYLTAGVRGGESAAGRKKQRQQQSKSQHGQGDNDNGSGNDDDSDGEESTNDEVVNGLKRAPETSSDGIFEFEGAQATVVYDEGDNNDADIDFGDLRYADPDNGCGADDSGDDVQDEFKPNLAFAGQIHVTLKSGLPYDQWNIKRLAKECGLVSHTTYPFELDAFPGYEHRRTLGFKQGLSKDENQEIRGKEPKLYAFCVKPEVEQTSESVPDADALTDATATLATAPAAKARPTKPQRPSAVNSESYDYKALARKRQRR